MRLSSSMADVFDINTKQKILFDKSKENEKDVDIIYQLGDEESLIFKDDEVLVTFMVGSLQSDSFWAMMCALFFLYDDSEGLDSMREEVLKKAVEKGIPHIDTEIKFDLDFDLD